MVIFDNSLITTCEDWWKPICIAQAYLLEQVGSSLPHPSMCNIQALLNVDHKAFHLIFSSNAKVVWQKVHKE